MAAAIALTLVFLAYQWVSFFEDAAGRQPKDLKPVRRRRRVAPQPVYRYTSLSNNPGRTKRRKK